MARDANAAAAIREQLGSGKPQRARSPREAPDPLLPCFAQASQPCVSECSPHPCAPLPCAEVMSFEDEKDLLLRWRDLVLETGGARTKGTPAPVTACCNSWTPLLTCCRLHPL